MCHYLRHEPLSEGLYLHEVLSAENRTGHAFDPSDWITVGQYAECALQTGKKLIWSEWAGGAWGWSDFLAQTSDLHSLAHRVLSKYKKTFAFLWADNRDVRNPDQLSDMLLAERAVQNLGNPQNPTLPAGRANPVRYSFPHGVSIQDWQWFEMNRDAKGRIPPSAGATLPPAMIGGIGISDFLHGGRFFEFETYWTNPRMLSGIVQLRDYIARAKNCPAATFTDSPTRPP